MAATPSIMPVPIWFDRSGEADEAVPVREARARDAIEASEAKATEACDAERADRSSESES